MSSLNQLQPTPGSNKSKSRRGRGSSGFRGDTCGRGYKGQKSRSGGSIRPGFEGGQMPFYLRTPKSGFSSRKQFVRETLPVSILNKIDVKIHGEVTISVLRELGLIRKSTLYVKFYHSGKVSHTVKVVGIPATPGAVTAIENAGGQHIES
jgi:large subunit ribosomal protein L15